MNTKPVLLSLAVLNLALCAVVAQPPPPPAAPAPSAQATPAILNPIVVNVLGEVNNPSRVTLPKGSGLLDAIAAADGFTHIANPSKTLLIHKTAGQKPDTIKVDLKQIMTGVAKDVVLRDGDTVVIGAAIF